MAYTNPWSDTDPPGSQAANTIDDEFRQLRLDIHERMDNIVVDWEADPVVLAAGASSIVGRDYAYNPGNSGDKATAPGDIKGILNLDLTGVADGGGNILINLNDGGFAEDWQAANIVGYQATGTIVTGDDPVRIQIIDIDAVANTFTLQFKKNDAGLAIGHTIAATVQVYFSVLPT